LDFLILDDETDILSRNVDTELLLNAAWYRIRAQMSSAEGCFFTVVPIFSDQFERTTLMVSKDDTYPVRRTFMWHVQCNKFVMLLSPMNRNYWSRKAGAATLEVGFKYNYY
jgi:hypothetical protein